MLNFELNKVVDISDEIHDSIIGKGAVVALESTIISHGMPFPENLETALEVENIIRKEGAIPATIAVIDGRIKIGLSNFELEQFAQGEKAVKVTSRDLPFALLQKQDGGTTVAATMKCASLVGISVFVTGGIGGVHRGSENTMDISGDLIELSRTNVAVVCAGIKSILDIPRTLEFLETHRVPVIGYRTDEFPAFFTINSGHSVHMRINSAEEIARSIRLKWEIGLEGGVVIANPVLLDDSMDEVVIEGAIKNSLRDASEKGIEGKAVTPFLLQKINELTKGESLRTNISLLYNNARLGSKIASAYGK